MATFKSDKVTNKQYLPSASPHSAREEYVVTTETAVTDALTSDDLVQLAVLPPNCIPTGIEVYITDIDGASSFVFDVGILNSDADDLVASSLLIDGSTVGQSAGVARNDDYECIYDPATWLAETDCPDILAEKIVALKVMTAAGTPAAGTVYTTLRYRAAENGV